MQDLKNKLIAGKNEQVQGYQKFANAQFYGKLMKSINNRLVDKRTWLRNSTLEITEIVLHCWTPPETASTQPSTLRPSRTVSGLPSTTAFCTELSTPTGPTTPWRELAITCGSTSSTTESRPSSSTRFTARFKTTAMLIAFNSFQPTSSLNTSLALLGPVS